MTVMPSLSHPELELRLVELTADSNASGSREDVSHESILIDLVEVYPKTADVKRNLSPGALLQHFQTKDFRMTRDTTGPPLLRVIFIDDPAYADSSIQPPYQRPALNKTAAWLHQQFDVSLSFFQNMSPSLHLRVTGNGYFIKCNENGDAVALVGFYQNSHGLTADPAHIWFSHSLQEPRSSVYVIYNSSEGAKKYIAACAETQDPRLLLRPLAVDAFMEEDYLHGWFTRLGHLRTRLVFYEDDTSISTFTPAQCVKAVEDLHNIDKHLHVAHGNFLDLEEKVPFLLSVREKYLALFNPPLQIPAQDINSVSESLALILMRGQHGHRWSSNYYERTGIRINLFFNLTTQADSRTNLDIARLTTKISVTAQRDSSSMITIAAVTMFFLPGSFVSALFSMVFFNSQTTETGQSILAVSSQWWLFPIVAVPLTVLVFFVWIIWRRRRQAAALKDVEYLQSSSQPNDIERSSLFSEKKHM